MTLKIIEKNNICDTILLSAVKNNIKNEIQASVQAVTKEHVSGNKMLED